MWNIIIYHWHHISDRLGGVFGSLSSLLVWDAVGKWPVSSQLCQSDIPTSLSCRSTSHVRHVSIWQIIIEQLPSQISNPRTFTAMFQVQDDWGYHDVTWFNVDTPNTHIVIYLYLVILSTLFSCLLFLYCLTRLWDQNAIWWCDDSLSLIPSCHFQTDPSTSQYFVLWGRGH